MRRYYLTGRNRTGETGTLRIEAESAEEAYAAVEAKGYHDIVLHTDDIEASVVDSTQASNGIMLEDVLSPHDHVAVRSRGTWGRFLYVSKVMYKKFWLAIAILTGASLYSLWNTGSTGLLFWPMVVVLGLPPVIAALHTLNAPSQYYMQHVEASAWGRWPQVLETAEKLRDHVPDDDLDFRCAQAYAGMGDLETGLSLIERYATSTDMAPSMYWSRRSSVYYNAHQYEEVLACARKAYEAEPDEPAMGLDLAIWLLEMEQDGDQARRMIEAVEKLHVGEILKMGSIYARGLLALDCKNLEKAESLFRESEEKHQTMAPGNPLIGWRADRSRIYRAITVAQMRRRDEALSLIDPAVRRFKALGDDLLLARLDRALAT